MANTPPNYQMLPSVTSGDLIQVISLSGTNTLNTFSTIGQVFQGGEGTAQAINTNAATGSVAGSASDITGGTDQVFLVLTGTLTGAATYTLPTLALTAAAITPAPIAGQTYRLRVLNSGSSTSAWTVATSTGWTLTGPLTVNQNQWRDFVVGFTTATAATLKSVGTGVMP